MNKIKVTYSYRDIKFITFKFFLNSEKIGEHKESTNNFLNNTIDNLKISHKERMGFYHILADLLTVINRNRKHLFSL